MINYIIKVIYSSLLCVIWMVKSCYLSHFNLYVLRGLERSFTNAISEDISFSTDSLLQIIPLFPFAIKASHQYHEKT